MLRSRLVGTAAVVSTFLNFAERTGKRQFAYFDVASEFQRNLVFGAGNHLSQFKITGLS
jgi:hypothetical protein